MRMKKTPRKRRRQGKTDYANRVGLLKSEKPRLVFRKTNKYFLVQYVLSEEAKDKIVFGTTSKELLKHGWPKDFAGSLKSIPAAYLTGYLFGKKIQAAKAETPIMDLGMIRTLHKTKVFLNPSPKEGWGLTVIEANCCGVPVVASDRPGLKDSVVDGQTGLLVPYGNPDAMAKAALEIIQNQTKFNNLSQAAKDWSEKFSWTKCADESLALFKKVIAEARS